MVSVATSDPSFAVVPDYYRKAVAWDETARQTAANERLGWTLAIDVSRRTDAGDRREVRVDLHDAAGAPIRDAGIRIEAYFDARAGAKQRVLLEPAPDQPGRYIGRLPVERDGHWTFHAVVHRGEDRFTAQRGVFIWPPGAGAPLGATTRISHRIIMGWSVQRY